MFPGLARRNRIRRSSVTAPLLQSEMPTSRAQILEAQRDRLLSLLREALAANPFYRSKLGGRVQEAGGLKALEVRPLEEVLDVLPFTSKEELLADQERAPPFGTNLTYALNRYTRIHQTSGSTGRPLRWLDTPESWAWFLRGWAEVYRGAGVAAGDRVFFPFSFGPFVGFWAAFESAAEVGALAIPAGGLTTSARIRLLIETGATVVAATPTYALHMAQTARAEGLDLSSTSVRALIVAGEPGGSIPATRERIEQAWGARVFDHCGMTETGPIGFECVEGPFGLHGIESELILEVIQPGSAERAGWGPDPHVREGELVVTSLGRVGSPVLRYRTGDFVRLSTRPCPCGRSSVRLEGGILGRLDDMVFVRGNNVYPAAIEAIIRRFTEVDEYRATVCRQGALSALQIEIEPQAGAPESLAKQIAAQVASAIERELFFRAVVRPVPPGSLPRFELKGKRFFKDRS